MPVESNLQPGQKWAFDAEVTRAFDDMLARSIPQYDVMRQDESFRREVTRARAEMFGRALGCIAEGSASGALVLRQLALKAKSESVKLAAARALLELGPRMRESVELEGRLRALEEQAAADEEKSDGRRGRW